MSRCSKKCNELKSKLDSISGLDDDFVYEKLCDIEYHLCLIEKYADLDELNGTCFRKKVENEK